MNTNTSPLPRHRDRRRKTLALLAGGLVLGVGGAVTLAAWNDSEFVSGLFASGQFDLEGSTDGTSFSSSPAAPGKTLTFQLDADALSPGDVVYTPFAVQLSADSGYEAAVQLASTGTGTAADELTYSVYESATFGADCSAASPPSGTAYITDSSATAAAVAVFTLTAAETPANMCIAVTAGTDLPQDSTGSITWEFVGESGNPLP